MTSPDTVERVLLVVAGWSLSSATTLVAYLVKRRRDRQRLFTRAFSAIESVFLDLQITPALRNAGAIESVPGLLDIDESWRYLIPPRPPSLPRDFEGLLTEVAEWEAIRGKTTLTRALEGFQTNIANLNAIHAGLEIQAQTGTEHISSRGLGLFNSLLEDLSEQCQQLFAAFQPHRLGVLAKSRRVFRRGRRRSVTKAVNKPRL